MHHDFHHALYLPVRWIVLAATLFWLFAAISTSAMPGLAYDEVPIPAAADLNGQLFAAALGAIAVGLPFRWSNAQPLFGIRMLLIGALAAWAIAGTGIQNIRIHEGRAIPGTVAMATYFAAAGWCAFESRRKSRVRQHPSLPSPGAN